MVINILIISDSRINATGVRAHHDLPKSKAYDGVLFC